MSASAWDTLQLSEFIAAVSAAETEAAAALIAVERVSEALEADVSAIVAGRRIVAAVGYPLSSAPADELAGVKPGAAEQRLEVPGLGMCLAAAASLEHPPGATFVVARPIPHGLTPVEAALLRGMARMASLTMRTLRVLDDERAMRAEVERLAYDQAALRRVATLVAKAAGREDIYAAVAEEIAHRLGADVVAVLHYERDGTTTIVGGWGIAAMEVPLGAQLAVAGDGVAVAVQATGRPARVEQFEGPDGTVAAWLRGLGVRSGVGGPIMIEDELWGVAIAASARREALPAGSEARIAEFTKLVETAIANAEARSELRSIADEQAALRRVATLVARGAAPRAVFEAVADEVAQLHAAESILLRYDPDDTAVAVGAASGTGRSDVIGKRFPLGGHNAATLVFETGRPARIDEYRPDDVSSATSVARGLGGVSAVGAPIRVAGHLWGAALVVAQREEALPAPTEERLADFAELAATAIANAETQAELTASRARVVASADEARRRIERNLHDGAQQRLVSVALQLRAAQADLPAGLEQLSAELDRIAVGLGETLEELQELARGIHPQILSDRGLRPALEMLARRSVIPVVLSVGTDRRLPEPVEVGAYYVVSEALTNAAKHAHATSMTVEVETVDGILHIQIHDDGVGGAGFSGGSGLVGLRDRVEVLGGRITLRSPLGHGTTLTVELPVREQAPAVTSG